MCLARKPLRCVNVFEGIKMCGYGDESRQLVVKHGRPAGVNTSLLVIQDTIKAAQIVTLMLNSDAEK